MLSIDVGGAGVALELRHWVNSGLMTFFFFVVGLEARREFDLGELRERKVRAAAAGRDRRNGDRRRHLPRLQHGWFVRARLGHRDVDRHGLRPRPARARGGRIPDRLRAFILTLVVVDDILALVVIATVYTEQVRASALLAALGVFGAVLVVRALGVRRASSTRCSGRRHG